MVFPFDSIYFYVATAIPAVLLGLIYYKQDLLLYVNYQPPGANERLDYDPRHHFRLEYEDVFLTAKDGTVIHSWFFPQRNESEVPTIIYFHGNAGNIAHRLPIVRKLYTTTNCNIHIVSYRGYGISKGAPSEAGLLLDAEAALDYVVSQRHQNDSSRRVFIFGVSLGGAVSIALTSRFQQQITGLILENTFTSVPDMIDVVFPYIRYFKFLCKNQWQSHKSIQQVKIPVLFLAGDADELVPHRMMQTLFNNCGSTDKSLKVFPGGTHNETHLRPGYFETVTLFIQRVLGQTQ